MPSSDIVLAFDAYGTLLSTESIAKKLATHFAEEKAQTIAVAWRRHQLEYTWRVNSMGRPPLHPPFPIVDSKWQVSTWIFRLSREER